MAQQRLRILIIGRGSREHALALKLSQSPNIRSIVVVPGNGGTHSNIKRTCNISGFNENDLPSILKLAQELSIDLIVPGPTEGIANGAGDYFRASGISCFAPSTKAAIIVASNGFAKEFMERHEVPTADYATFTDVAHAKEYVKNSFEKDPPYKMVIKASSLVDREDVVIPKTVDEAFEALNNLMPDYNSEDFENGDVDSEDIGNEVVVEEFLDGEEVSIHAFSNGVSFKCLPAAQVYKQIFDGNLGAITGGMGCYAPAEVVTPYIMEEIERLIIKPTVDGLMEEDIPYTGMLSFGIKLTKSGPKCIGYNVRLGDLEAQTLLPLLKSDLAEIMLACITVPVSPFDLVIQSKFCATVLITSAGYPGPYKTGHKVNFKRLSDNGPPTNLCTTTEELMEEFNVDRHVHYLHAGTRLDHHGALLTDGGRVMVVMAKMDTLEKAVKAAYLGVKWVSFEGMHFRKDIAYRWLLGTVYEEE